MGHTPARVPRAPAANPVRTETGQEVRGRAFGSVGGQGLEQVADRRIGGHGLEIVKAVSEGLSID
ncbi:hypothetical protein [Streptomyces sp. NPDC055506]